MDDQMTSSFAAFTARIDRLPFAWPHYRIMLLMMVLMVIEAIDLSVTAMIVVPLRELYHLTSGQIGLFATMSTFGVVVGLIPSGFLQDRYGRKKVCIWGMALFAVFTGSMGFASGIVLPSVFRFIAGLGCGAVFPIPYTYLAEFMPNEHRGRGVAGGQVALAIGYSVTPLIAMAVYSAISSLIGWRIVSFICFIPLLFIPILVKYLPESPRWLLQNAFDGQAESIIGGMEQYYLVRGQVLREPVPVDIKNDATLKGKEWDFLKGPYLKRWIVTVLMFIGSFVTFYLSITYLPMIMKDRGFSLIGGVFFAVILNAWSILGNIGQGYSADKLGRRKTLLFSALIGGLSMILFPYVKSYIGLVGVTAIMGIFAIPIFLVVKTYCGECFPTYTRATAAASAETVSRLLGGVLPMYIVPFALSQWGVGIIYWISGLLMLILVGVVGLVFLRETKGMSMEETCAINL